MRKPGPCPECFLLLDLDELELEIIEEEERNAQEAAARSSAGGGGRKDGPAEAGEVHHRAQSEDGAASQKKEETVDGFRDSAFRKCNPGRQRSEYRRASRRPTGRG